MQTHTIPQKMSGTGSIHDLASEHYDRDIKFPEGAIYAVVLADYYGGRGYTTHKTAGAAIKSSKSSNQHNDYSHAIIDIDGNSYCCNPDRGLVLRDAK